MVAAPVVAVATAVVVVVAQGDKEIAEVGVIPGPAWEPVAAVVAAKAELEERAAHIIHPTLMTQAQAAWDKCLQLRSVTFSTLAAEVVAVTAVALKVLAGQVLAETEAAAITPYLLRVLLIEVAVEAVTVLHHLRAGLAGLAALV
jgi:hypothetical protein